MGAFVFVGFAALGREEADGLAVEQAGLDECPDFVGLPFAGEVVGLGRVVGEGFDAGSVVGFVFPDAETFADGRGSQ